MRVYFMGICGTAMGNAALLLRELGHEVFGADSGVYPPMSEHLAEAGIEVFEGFDVPRLERAKPDLVVVGNAMSRGNVEVEWLLEQTGLRYLSLPQLLSETVLYGRAPVVVAGTHGKTTTSALTAFLLERSGERPGWLIGGLPRDLPGGARLGEGRPFVIEGDEYDSAFFDKRSKFIHYRPRIATINNLEMDHADIFRDLADVQRSFRHFTRIIPASGRLLVNGDDTNIEALLPTDWTRVFRVGTGDANDLVIRDFRDGPEGASFTLVWREAVWAEVRWPLHGLFNARNAAMASLAAASAAGREDPVGFDLSALGHFGGVRRRQDLLAETEAWTVIEDFAHHPSAIARVIEALRAAYPERKLTVCFEPRSNTACSSLFQREFQAALSGADRVYLGAVHRAERLKPEARLDAGAIAARLPDAAAFATNDALLRMLEADLTGEDAGVVVFLTNGSFDGVPARFATRLEQEL